MTPRSLSHSDLSPAEKILRTAIEGPTVRPELGPCLDSPYAPSNPRPLIVVNGRRALCSRIILAHTLGRPIREKLQANHHCDRLRCVRPEHLYEGNQQDNLRDCVTRGRHTSLLSNPSVIAKSIATRKRNGTLGFRGTKHPTAKLNESAVLVIRYLASKGFTKARIARAYGMSRPTISKIASGNLWTHVSL